VLLRRSCCCDGVVAATESLLRRELCSTSSVEISGPNSNFKLKLRFSGENFVMPFSTFAMIKASSSRLIRPRPIDCDRSGPKQREWF